MAKAIADEGLEGGMVVLDPKAQRLWTSDPAWTDRAFVPASTFKIPNSLIAWQTGVVDGPDFTLPWDGVERWSAAWNRDHDLRSAFTHSVVWYYQELARRVGEARMAQWVEAADYGNADIGGGIDRFWLNGELRISPRQQVEFLQRLHEGTSPFDEELVRRFLDEVMVFERRGETVVRAKTGWATAADFADPSQAGFGGHLGWFVGSVESPRGEQVYFAIVLTAPDPAPDFFGEKRKQIALAWLERSGWLPPGESP